MHKHDVDKLNEIKPTLTPSSEIATFTNFFKAFGNQTRARILLALFDLKELCQYEICYLLDMEKSAISHQMKILIENRVVKSKKVGKEVFYRLHDEHVITLIETTKEHIYGQFKENTNE